VVAGALKNIDLDGSFKGKVLRRFKEIRTQKVSPATLISDPERELEIARATEWRQLLPVKDHPEIAGMCERALVAVRDLGLPKRVQPVQEPEPRKLARKRLS
jgi:hypothetical protein